MLVLLVILDWLCYFLDGKPAKKGKQQPTLCMSHETSISRCSPSLTSLYCLDIFGYRKYQNMKSNTNNNSHKIIT